MDRKTFLGALIGIPAALAKREEEVETKQVKIEIRTRIVDDLTGEAIHDNWEYDNEQDNKAMESSD